MAYERTLEHATTSVAETEGRRYNMRAVTALVAIATIALSGCEDKPSTDPEPPSSSARDVYVGSGDMKYPNSTMQDWLSFADRVVIVSATDEAIREPATPQVGQYVPRHVTVHIDEEVWSRENAEDFTSPWTYDAFGEAVLDDGSGPALVRVADEGESRVELGHSYLMGIYYDDHCRKGDPEWVPLGALPFDGGVLGVGEYEGSERTLEEATSLPTNSRDQDLAIYTLSGMNFAQIQDEFEERESQPTLPKYRCPGDPQD